jgi:hypothetical protein
MILAGSAGQEVEAWRNDANTAWQTGQHIAASGTSGLAAAFQTVAAAILRLAQ